LTWRLSGTEKPRRDGLPLTTFDACCGDRCRLWRRKSTQGINLPSRLLIRICGCAATMAPRREGAMLSEREVFVGATRDVLVDVAREVLVTPQVRKSTMGRRLPSALSMRSDGAFSTTRARRELGTCVCVCV
jgi:hypothetical protein